MAHLIERILVVDPTSDIQEVLKGQGEYDITFIDSSARVMEHIEKDPYDMVLLDGPGALGRIRDNLTRGHIPIIMVTAKGKDIDGVRAMEMGANDYITRPFDLSSVISRIKTQIILAGIERKEEQDGGEGLDNLVKSRNSYLIAEKGYSQSISLFTNLTRYGAKGLLLTTRHPDVIRQTYGPGEFAGMFLWLSASEHNQKGVNPANLTEVHHKVSDFIRNKGDPIILLLGLETMITLNDFNKVFRLLSSLVDLVRVQGSRMIVSVDPETMDPREMNLLESILIKIRGDEMVSPGKEH